MVNRFSENVNAVSMMIAGLTNDIAERLGITAVLYEIYKYELQKNLFAIPTRPDNNQGEKNDASETNESDNAAS